jgi:phosphoribosyl 1,2-cyclic phosphate phosphodiesterase
VFNFRQRAAIPCYGSADTIARLRQIFAYVFEDGPEGGGRPKLDLVPVRAEFELLGERVVPVPVWHGGMEVFGYRVGGFALVTDVNRVPEESLRALAGAEVLILSALRYRPHPTHFNFEQAIEVARRVGARRTIFTHIAHEVDHADLRVALPPGVEIGYDGLVVDFD